MDRNKNIALFKSIMSEFIYNTAKIEDINATFPQTKTIIDGMSVTGLSMDDVLVISNLKSATYKVIEFLRDNKEFNLYRLMEINHCISKNESIEWGVLRNGEITVGGTSFVPKIPDVDSTVELIQRYDFSSEEQIIEFMYTAIKRQLFWDGNKRTSILAANFLLINNSLGCLLIKDQLLEEWNYLLNRLYEHNELDEIVTWTLENAIVKIKYS